MHACDDDGLVGCIIRSHIFVLIYLLPLHHDLAHVSTPTVSNFKPFFSVAKLVWFQSDLSESKFIIMYNILSYPSKKDTTTRFAQVKLLDFSRSANCILLLMKVVSKIYLMVWCCKLCVCFDQSYTHTRGCYSPPRVTRTAHPIRSVEPPMRTSPQSDPSNHPYALAPNQICRTTHAH